MNRQLNIVTALIRSNNEFDNRSRFALLRKIVLSLGKQSSILLLPGGFLEFKSFQEKNLIKLGLKLSEIIELNSVCL